MADEVIIVEHGDERVQKIARAISSQTAGEVLSLLREGTHTSTELANRLNLPLTTVQYHLENLMDAGIISVVEKRWSRKGREIKVFGLQNQLLIVAPRTGDVRSLLLKYASIFGIFVLAGVVMTMLFSLIALQSSPPLFLEKTSGGEEAVRAPNVMDYEEPESSDSLLPLLFFLAGGSCIIIAGVGRELWRLYQKRQLSTVSNIIEDQ